MLEVWIQTQPRCALHRTAPAQEVIARPISWLSHREDIYEQLFIYMQPILVHFEKSTVDALKAERQRTGCSVSEFIRRAVIAALEKKAEGKP